MRPKRVHKLLEPTSDHDEFMQLIGITTSNNPESWSKNVTFWCGQDAIRLGITRIKRLDLDRLENRVLFSVLDLING
jgi:hypothetical protein